MGVVGLENDNKSAAGSEGHVVRVRDGDLSSVRQVKRETSKRLRMTEVADFLDGHGIRMLGFA
jgi:hypothetical protein